MGYVRTLFRYLILFVFATLLTTSPVSASSFSFVGSGWGHGVGLSQYGAKAMASDGASHIDIISKYFLNSSVTPYTATENGTFLTTEEFPLWVGLRQNSDNISFIVETGSARLCFDQSNLCVANALPNEHWWFGLDGKGSCIFSKITLDGAFQTFGPSSECSASILPTSKDTIIRVPFKARSYKRGILKVRQNPVSKKLHTVYALGVEDYMKGVSEVPDSWPESAIEAQVVTSRSYVVWNAIDRGESKSFDLDRKNECYCNIYDDSRDQVFRGYSGEVSHPIWVKAVDSTFAKVISYFGSTALGMYSSSSGGFTENYYDVFESDGHPYLVTVNDSAAFSDSASNPHAIWTAGYSQKTLAQAFNFSWVVDAKIKERNVSGSVKTVLLKGTLDGKPLQKEISGVLFRNVLSLRSTDFEIETTLRFEDVGVEHPFSTEILGLDVLEITQGCTITNFCPDKPVTRAEMAAFLTRALELPFISTNSPFSDDNNHQLESEIASIAAYGITQGCTITNFCPDKPVTRAEMAAFLTRGL